MNESNAPNTKKHLRAYCPNIYTVPEKHYAIAPTLNLSHYDHLFPAQPFQ